MIRQTTAAIVLALTATMSVTPATAAPGHLRLAGGSPIKIIKIQYKQSGTNLDTEYVVIKNVTGHRVAITGWRMTSSPSTDNQSYKFGLTHVRAGRKLTLYSGFGANSRAKQYWGSVSPIWNNDGDKAVLSNSNGNVMDTCMYAGGGTTAYC